MVTSLFFNRSEMGRRPKAIGAEIADVTIQEPRKVTSAPKLHVPPPLFPPGCCALADNDSLGFEPANVLDIGANKGDWTRKMHQIFPAARFLMVDGNAETFKTTNAWADLLALRTSSRKRTSSTSGGRGGLAEAGQAETALVEAEAAILDSTAHDVVWHTAAKPTWTGASLFKQRAAKSMDERLGVGRTIARHAETLDLLLERTGRAGRRFSLIKIDVQGAELRVLQGATRTLSSATVVIMELGNIGADWNAGAPSFAEKLSFMHAAGFRPWDLPETVYKNVRAGRFKGAKILVNVDLVFVRSNSKLANLTQDIVDA